MSVILDALKRVQDENRRRDAVATTESRKPIEHGSNALLRRLGASGGQETQNPEGPSAAPGTRKVSPVLLLSLVGAVGVAIAMGILWLMQPEVAAPGANDGRPRLTAAQRPDTGGPGSQQPPVDRGVPLGGAVPTDEPTSVRDELMAAAQPPAVQSGDFTPGDAARAGDMTDLSGNLPARPPSLAESQGNFRLEVSETGGSVSSSASPNSIDLSSQNADGTTGRATVPNRLVDPGVRSAFAEGVRLQKAGDLAGAESAYKRALRHDAYNARVNANLGVLYESQGRLALAEQHLRRSIAVETDNAAAHNNLGVVLYRQGNYDTALVQFDRTLALDPSHLDAYTNTGLIYTRWGKYDEAARAFMEVLARDPENPLAHYNLGLVYEESQQYDKAANHYSRFLAHGSADHPEIAAYLNQHLSWLQSQRGGPGGGPR